MKRLIGKVTIVIPYYNNLNGLKRLLDSIPSEYVNIVVVDDNSCDEQSCFIISGDYSSVEFYINEKSISNAGSARNFGLSKVKTEYVMFADSDDYFCSNAFNVLSDIIDDDLDLACFYTATSSNVLNKKSTRNVYYNELIDLMLEDDSNTDFVRYKMHVPWSKLISMRVINDNKILFDEVDVSNDVYFSTLVGHHAERIRVFNDYVYCVTYNESGLTRNLSKKNMHCRWVVAMRNNRFLYDKSVENKFFMNTKGFFVRSGVNLLKPGVLKKIYQYISYLLAVKCWK